MSWCLYFITLRINEKPNHYKRCEKYSVSMMILAMTEYVYFGRLWITACSATDWKPIKSNEYLHWVYTLFKPLAGNEIKRDTLRDCFERKEQGCVDEKKNNRLKET